MDYPANFRLPEWNGFKYSIDPGVLRSAGQSAPQQRRRYDHAPAAIDLIFLIKNNDFGDWWRWWNENAFSWFNMPVQYWTAGAENCEPKRVRCISEISIIAFGDYLQCSLVVEHEI